MAKGAMHKGMARPVRVQLSRHKGWRIPANTMKVDRSTKWGNPFTIDAVRKRYGIDERAARQKAVDLFRAWHAGHLDAGWEDTPAGPSPSLDGLQGRNLACWCALNVPCHADVLLELANAPASTQVSPAK